jgi:NADPH-dependent ferric siderophore reductase
VTTSPHRTSIDLAQRLSTNANVCEVVKNNPLSTSLREIVLQGSAEELCGVPGNDVMIRLGDASGSFTRRRYSVRSVDAERDQFTLWICTTHDGLGSRWAQSTVPGDAVDVVGPRGKIPLDPNADWHLFIGDVTGFSAFYRMAQSIESPGKATVIVEIDHDDDTPAAQFREGVAVSAVFVNRSGRSRTDPSGLLNGLGAFAFPLGEGHAYLFGEFSIINVLRAALLDRGLSDEQINRKAYWRVGRRNAENGEPEKDQA